jgi:hypothetical protein
LPPGAPEAAGAAEATPDEATADAATPDETLADEVAAEATAADEVAADDPGKNPADPPAGHGDAADDAGVTANRSDD